MTPTPAPTDPARSPAPAAPDDAGTGALRSLLPVLGAHRATVLRTCLAALVDQAALVALVTLAAYTVGTAVTEHRPPTTGTVAVLIGLVLLRALATWREMDLSHDLAYRVLAELRVRVFDGLARSAPARIAGGAAATSRPPRSGTSRHWSSSTPTPSPNSSHPAWSSRCRPLCWRPSAPGCCSPSCPPRSS